MKAPRNQYEGRYLRLLKMAPFQRRGGAWRFGANKLSDQVVDRLVAGGRAEIDGDQVRLTTAGTQP